MGARPSLPLPTHSYQQPTTASTTELATWLTNVPSLSSLPFPLIELISQYAGMEWYIFVFQQLANHQMPSYMTKWPLTSSTQWIPMPDIPDQRSSTSYAIHDSSLIFAGGGLGDNKQFKTIDSLNITSLQMVQMDSFVSVLPKVTLRHWPTHNNWCDPALASCFALPSSSSFPSSSFEENKGVAAKWSQTIIPIDASFAGRDATLVMVRSSTTAYKSLYVFNSSRHVAHCKLATTERPPLVHHAYNMDAKEWSTFPWHPDTSEDASYTQTGLISSYNNDGCVYFFNHPQPFRHTSYNFSTNTWKTLSNLSAIGMYRDTISQPSHSVLIISHSRFVVSSISSPVT
jgi:hypothetical protein